MRQVVIEKPVRDVDGLLKALRSATPAFDVLSVASDPRRTYVYLQTWEENDPTPFVRAWEDIPELSISTVGNQGADGVYEAVADGFDAHTLLVRKITAEGKEVSGDEGLQVETPNNIEHSPRYPVLSDGQVMVKIGPSKRPMDFQVTISDTGRRMKSVTAKLRFVAQPPVEGSENQPPQEASDGFLRKLKRMFRVFS